MASGQVFEWSAGQNPGASMHALPNGVASDGNGHVFVVVEWAGPPGANLPVSQHRNPNAFLPSTDFFVFEYSTVAVPTNSPPITAGELINVFALTTSDIPPTGDPTVSYQFYTPVGIVISGGTAYIAGTYSGNDGVNTPEWGESCYFLTSLSTSTAPFSSTFPVPPATTGPIYLTPTFSPHLGTGYVASAMVMGPDGYIYVTGTNTTSGVTTMYTVKFASTPTDVAGANGTTGTCLAAYGTSASPVIVIGGSDSNKFAIWTYQHGSTDQTYAINSIAGDTVVSVAVNSNNQIFATGTSQRVDTGTSFYYQDTTTVKSTLTGSTPGTISLIGTLNGNPNAIDGGLPTGYAGVDGAKQVIIDPSSTDGKPIVLCTNTAYTTVLKYYVTGGTVWTSPIRCYPPTVVAGKITKSWNSQAVLMQATSGNKDLYVVGTGLESQNNAGSFIYCDYLASKITLNDGGVGDGAFVWPTGINGTYNWNYSTANGTYIVASGMVVFTDSSSVDHICITGGYVPTLSTAYTILIH